ncbi:MAG: TatD family hydrolase [Pseudobdellovibrionaceae bacterium]
MWIDSHCHLNHGNIQQAGTPAELVAALADHDVDACLTVSCTISKEYKELLNIAEAFPNVWASVGTHPHDAGLAEEMAYDTGDLIKLAEPAKIVAIGETGLDYYYDNSPREAQKESFRKHIRACLAADLPVIIHTRDAEEDTIQILKEEGQGRLNGVFHCFSGSSWLADQALNMGFYISFSGILTFPKALELKEIATRAPLERLLVETDSPYLAPVPLRGRVNTPSNVKLTGSYLSKLKVMDEETVAHVTSENFYKLFTKAQKPSKTA